MAVICRDEKMVHGAGHDNGRRTAYRRRKAFQHGYWDQRQLQRLSNGSGRNYTTPHARKAAGTNPNCQSAKVGLAPARVF